MALPTATLRASLSFLPVAAGLFCIQLGFFSLGLALPTMATDLGTTVTNLQWLISGYMIALSALLIPSGRLGDMLGRRDVICFGGLRVVGATGGDRGRRPAAADDARHGPHTGRARRAPAR